MIPNGLAIERCYLRLDLFFPLVYGTTLAAASVIAAHFSKIPFLFTLIFTILPLIGMLADWTENRIQLQQLRRYMGAVSGSGPAAASQAIADDETGAAEALEPDRISLASRATQIKLISIGLSYIQLACLVAWMLHATCICGPQAH